MNKLLLYSIALAFLTSCNESKKTKTEPEKARWEFKETIILPQEIRPLSISIEEGEIWLSDPEHNRLLKINRQGELLDSITELQRPMNITFFEGKLYVPEYLSDRILVIAKKYQGFSETHEPIKCSGKYRCINIANSHSRFLPAPDFIKKQRW